jgi:N-acetylglucosaminyl-diphospho-decaprenol L-rhamnosyltransferase
VLKCIQSIFKYIGKNTFFEVIVVDNNSSDGSANAIAQKFPEVKLIQNKHNVGFPAANNQGFAIVTGDYVLMLNPDTEVVDDSIQRLLTYYKTINNAGIITPKLLNPDRTIQRVVWRFPKVRYIIAEILYLKSLFPRKYYKEKDFGTSFEVDSMSGAAMFFSKDVLSKLGGLNEKLFWIEDVDFCYRASRIGLHNYYCADAMIIHHIGQSAKTNYNLAIYYQIMNKVNFYKVHGSLISVIILWIISLINIIIKTLVFLILSPFNRVWFYKAKAYMYAFMRFLSFN